MSNLVHIKAEIESLKEQEISELCSWLSDLDLERWDREIEDDSRSAG